MGNYPIWRQEAELLPTLPNCTENIVGEERNECGQLILKIQCATCLNTVKDVMILALLQMNHGNEDERGFNRAVLPYKRCRECRNNYREVEA